jgi:hypothetical protein
MTKSPEKRIKCIVKVDVRSPKTTQMCIICPFVQWIKGSIAVPKPEISPSKRNQTNVKIADKLCASVVPLICPK